MLRLSLNSFNFVTSSYFTFIFQGIWSDVQTKAGTQHNKIRMVGWLADSFRKYYHFVAPSCKLELARFSVGLRIQDGAECGNRPS